MVRLDEPLIKRDSQHDDARRGVIPAVPVAACIADAALRRGAVLQSDSRLLCPR